MYNARTLIQFMVILLVSAFTLNAESDTTSAISINAYASGIQSQTDPSSMAEEIRAWRELQYGMFIHYSLSTFDGKEQTPGSTTSVGIYKPTDLDVDQWIRVAKEAGMKYAVLTAKHSSGFCLWDSKVQWKGKEFDYDVAASTVKTDVVDAFMAACNKYGIVPGIYYCIMDTRHSDTSIEWTPSLPYVSEEYFQLMKDHLTELHTRHPSIAIQWIDIPRHLTYEQRDTLYTLVRNLNADCLIEYNYGKESGDIKGDYNIAEAMKVTWPTDIFNSEVYTIKLPFQVQQEYNGTTYELGYEHCISLDDGWFWDEDSKPKSLYTLTSVWDQTNTLNGNFLLNVPPDKTGQIPEVFIQRLDEFKSYLNIDSVSSSFEHHIYIPEPEFKLSQNYPNPFNQFTTINYTLNRSGNVFLKIYNLSGQEIETLVNEQQTAGKHEIIWQPNELPGAMYFYKLQAVEFSETKKLILRK